MESAMPQPAKFNTLLGYAPGDVPVYSSHYPSADDAEFPNRKAYRSYIDGIFMGYKWQCVEFARRWLYLNNGCIFDNIPMAYDIFHLRTLRSVRDHTILPLRSFRNGAKRHPEPGCMLIWEEGGEFEQTGHVAIVTEVFDDRIRIVEQNVSHSVWLEGQHYSRELPAHIDADGGYRIECTYDDADVLGWVIQTDDDSHAEVFSQVTPALLDLQPGSVASSGEPALPDRLQPEEKAFVAFMGGYTLTRNPQDQARYFRMSESAHKAIRHAGNEMHAMFMQATDHVLENDALLERFGFPRVLWPRLRESWNNRRNHMITGRLDFSVSGRGIKLYEYNADSASCYMECGSVQGRWAELHACLDGWCPGEHLHEMLVHAWKKSAIGDVLHIMQDNDLEETYHALYMKSAIEEAGIPCKVIRGLGELTWGDDGAVVDRDGLPIRWVWKTWAWETALDQLRSECAEDEQPQLPDRQGRARSPRPRLVDVLLRKEVKVFEPLWTLVPSNKAILPVLWELFPDHPCLLDAQFNLTADLRRKAYVTKPIVGRCGSNISIVGTGEHIIESTDGQFEERDLMYQEFFGLPQIDGLYLQVSTFIVDGRHAGTCLRVDTSPIITGGSDILPLRIVPDGDLLPEA
ncbi:MAG: bifunctional glutathionylspermidine amidase/synthase [Zetaproteobacteria bacterium CG12_big_fil_rev_8_21_14_0_65_54_13]|nr:MAG: bifunctional glutathionylspermidine amidase/synthase [Zetaproteobacteria bacterium CG12_big_fil_rev_8_21_14_0_65_54_13]PIX53419.1 MAG: bifunctional glutathionylspermidine amidase/synthase [Zetaproteobacteria bacterium CG_4_10_14_3_um_filter_54_28]PJA30984.1 MAG: bifunctional glutathionylspermidine amidase/synthase [Zetaproteobacteria bacterium CG_4_9_14_3_um_filter_54_145]